MHSQLDIYLKRLEVELRALPGEQRSSELAEMRQHLDSMIQAYRELGYTEADSVKYAIQQFGNSRQVGRKLVKATTTRRRFATGRRLCLTAWWLFIVSLAMPACTVFGGVMRGYACAVIVLFGSLPYSTFVGAVYYHALGAANLWLLFYPLLTLRIVSRKARYVSTALSALAAILVASLWTNSGWCIGFYVWIASFALTATGSALIALDGVSSATKKRFAV